MALTSSSTDATVTAQYETNSTYYINDSVAECRLFCEACEYLIRRTVSQAESGDESVREDVERIERRLSAALKWLAENDSTSSLASSHPSVKVLSVENYTR